MRKYVFCGALAYPYCLCNSVGWICCTPIERPVGDKTQGIRRGKITFLKRKTQSERKRRNHITHTGLKAVVV